MHTVEPTWFWYLSVKSPQLLQTVVMATSENDPAAQSAHVLSDAPVHATTWNPPEAQEVQDLHTVFPTWFWYLLVKAAHDLHRVCWTAVLNFPASQSAHLELELSVHATTSKRPSAH